MKGYIDTYPVTFFLYNKNGSIDGQYYYDNKGEPIGLTGALKGDTWTAMASAKESFRAHVTDSSMSGTWYNGKRTLTLRLTDVTGREGYLPFAFIWVKGTQKRLRPNPNFTDGPSYDAAAVWPSDSSAMSVFLRKEVFSILDLKAPQEPLGQALLAAKKRYLAESNTEDVQNLPPFELDETVGVLWQDARILSLENVFYEYFGGAHGMDGRLFYCYDLSRQELLKITDVLDTVHYGMALSRMMEAKFRRDNHLPVGAKLDTILNDDTIPLTGNFYLTGKGIGFEYQPTQIAPYVTGSISFFFTYAVLMPYLQPRFKALISPASPRYLPLQP